MVRTSDSKSENQGSIPCRGVFLLHLPLVNLMIPSQLVLSYIRVCWISLICSLSTPLYIKNNKADCRFLFALKLYQIKL